jgi:hypothetical protein
MTRSLIVEVSVVETALPPGMKFVDYTYTLTPKAAPSAAMRLLSVAQSVVFDGLSDGGYTVSVQARALDAVPLGPPVTADVVVGTTAGPQTYMAPSGLGLLVV